MEKNTKSPTTLLKKPTPTSSGDPVNDSNAWSEDELLGCKEVYGVSVLHVNATRMQLNDKTLPNDAYTVTYVVNGVTQTDIARCGKKVKLFDCYYDKFGKDLKCIDFGPGTANPKTWGYEKAKPKSKK